MIPKGSHKCPVKGCEGVIPNRLLMCLSHWRQVPPAMQRAVLLHYRRGQTLRTASTAWFEAVKAAIHHVNSLNRAPTP